jgi:hypothetical protein
MKTYRVNGKDCIDATSNLTINVASIDNQLASRKDENNCVIARACMKKTGLDAEVRISRLYLKSPFQDVWTRYHIKNALRSEIIAFDRGGDISPGNYTIYKPSKDMLLGSTHTGGPKKVKQNPSRQSVPRQLQGVRKHG